MKKLENLRRFLGFNGCIQQSLTPKHGGFRVNTKIRKQIERRKRRIARRLDKNDNRGCDRPIMTASNIHYEIADRTRATAHGGIGAMHLLVRKLGLDRGDRPPPRPAEDPSALPRLRPRAEHRLQPAGRRNVPGTPGTAPQRRGVPRRPGGPPHSRSRPRRATSAAASTRPTSSACRTSSTPRG